jgi:hypothetical protein
VPRGLPALIPQHLADRHGQRAGGVARDEYHRRTACDQQNRHPPNRHDPPEDSQWIRTRPPTLKGLLVVVLELRPQLVPRLVRLPAHEYRGALLLVVHADAVVQPGQLGAVGEPLADLLAVVPDERRFSSLRPPPSSGRRSATCRPRPAGSRISGWSPS